MVLKYWSRVNSDQASNFAILNAAAFLFPNGNSLIVLLIFVVLASYALIVVEV